MAKIFKGYKAGSIAAGNNTPTTVSQLAATVSHHRGATNAGKARILSELYSMLQMPAIQHLISENAVVRLDEFMKRPFSDTKVLQRAADILGTSVVATAKAYHSGKGDDYESVAMVFGNPSAPISLSGAGFLSPHPGGSRHPEILTAMKTYGGHFITTNLDVGLQGGPYKLPDKIREAGNKGNTYVQVDYTIVIPAKYSSNGKIKIFLIEFKAGETHLVMAIDEAYQLRKAKALYEMWWGANNVDVTMIYHPFLAGRADFSPELRNKHAVGDVVYVNFEGMCKFLKLNERNVRRIGMARFKFTVGIGEAASKVWRYTEKLIEEATVAASGKALAAATTGNAVANPMNLLGSVKLANALMHSGKETINNIFGTNIGRVLPNGRVSNTLWKEVSEKLIFLLLKREELKARLNAANQTQGILGLYGITREILSLDPDGRILRPEVASKLKKFIADVERVVPIHKNQPVPPVLGTNYVVEYIKLRSESLGAAMYDFSLDQIPEDDRIILAERRAAAAAAVGAANAAINAAIANMRIRKMNNVNFTPIFMSVFNSQANKDTKTARLAKLFKAFGDRFDTELTQVFEPRYTAAIVAGSLNGLEAVKTNLLSLANKRNANEAKLRALNTNRLLPRARGQAGNTIRAGKLMGIVDPKILLLRKKAKK